MNMVDIYLYGGTLKYLAPEIPGNTLIKNNLGIKIYKIILVIVRFLSK